ncbi:MAG: Ig-like domain-containing protein, partial [Helicobacteraceae bacterium]|nr:Ig-like domain-containing protein [Helicobacteraceae bacterium]
MGFLSQFRVKTALLFSVGATALFFASGCDSSDAQKESGSSMSSRSSSFVTYDADEDALKSIELPDIIALWKSQEYTFEPVFTPQDATNKELAWDCNDTSIVSIEQNGTITAKAIGEVTITAVSAIDSSVSASAKVIVDREIARIATGGYHSVLLDSKGGVWVAGLNDKGQLGLGNYDNSARFVK